MARRYPTDYNRAQAMKAREHRLAKAPEPRQPVEPAPPPLLLDPVGKSTLSHVEVQTIDTTKEKP